MDVILTSVTWQIALVNFDNIIIFSQTPEKHIDHVKQFLTQLQLARDTVKMTTRLLSRDTVDHLGHVIRLGRLEIAADTTDAIRNLKHQRKTTE